MVAPPPRVQAPPVLQATVRRRPDGRAPTPGTPRLVRMVLWLTVPIAVGGVVASAAGLLSSATYAGESANWAAQGAGQDVVNLVVFPAMLAAAWRAARGSVRAHLVWLGLAGYAAYSYLLYAGYLHFSGWFLLYVAVFGLSTWALVAGAGLVDPGRLRAAFDEATPTRPVGAVLATLGVLFAVLWLSEIVPASITGATPEPIAEAGLVTNPVWILDLAVVLPGMVLAGVLLRRERPLGYLLAAPLLSFGTAMAVAIVGMFAMLAARGEPVEAVPVVMIAVVAVVEAVALRALLAGLPAETPVAAIVRPTARMPAG